MSEENKTEEKTLAPYAWAANVSKLQRAKDEVAGKGIKFKDEAKEEEAVKVVYIRLLGHIVGEPARGSKEKDTTDIAAKLEEAREEGRQEGMSDEALDKIKEDAREEGREEIRKEIEEASKSMKTPEEKK